MQLSSGFVHNKYVYMLIDSSIWDSCLEMLTLLMTNHLMIFVVN